MEQAQRKYMEKQTIHWLNPVIGHHACGMADPNSLSFQVSEDIEQVTCKSCLRSISGQMALAEALEITNQNQQE
jgi:hypothetical protein